MGRSPSLIYPLPTYGPGITYDVVTLLDSPASGGTLSFGTYQDELSLADVQAMRLHIGGRTFNFADATYAFETATSTHSYAWSLSPRFGWATGQTVAVKITALPIVGITALTTQVQYGVAGNWANAQAEFQFTRTGSTKEALSFPVMHFESGETSTRTFKAGQSTFSNYHWAIDVDASNNPVCTITWVVKHQSGDDYVLFLPLNFIADVIVSGPGTTCQPGM